MKVRVKFEWRDMWMGAFWEGGRRALYVCVLPMLPVVFQFKVRCPTCGGTGWASGEALVKHARCNGTGRVYGDLVGAVDRRFFGAGR